jgi:hypothetical protein
MASAAPETQTSIHESTDEESVVTFKPRAGLIGTCVQILHNFLLNCLSILYILIFFFLKMVDHWKPFLFQTQREANAPWMEVMTKFIAANLSTMRKELN